MENIYPRIYQASEVKQKFIDRIIALGIKRRTTIHVMSLWLQLVFDCIILFWNMLMRAHILITFCRSTLTSTNRGCSPLFFIGPVVWLQNIYRFHEIYVAKRTHWIRIFPVNIYPKAREEKTLFDGLKNCFQSFSVCCGEVRKEKSDNSITFKYWLYVHS